MNGSAAGRGTSRAVVGTLGLGLTHALVLVAALSAASCACTNPRKTYGWDGTPPAAPAAAASSAKSATAEAPANNAATAAPAKSATADASAKNTAAAATAAGATADAAAKSAAASSPNIAVEVAGDTEKVAIDGAATYTITVTNNGSDAASDIAVNCALPDTVEYHSAEGATAANRSGSNITFAPLATLAPKASAKWTVKVRAAKEGDANVRVGVATKANPQPIEKTVTTTIRK